jgi:methionine--tRNA ligase beta chain
MKYEKSHLKECFDIFTEDIKRGESIFKPLSIEEFEKRLLGLENKVVAVVKEENGEVAGFAFGSISEASGYVSYIGVKRDYRRKGIGTELYSELEKEMQEKAEAAKKMEKPEGCAQIGIDDFAKVELRSAEILECEKVPKAKKLLKLQVDLGYEKRQVVSGIAKFYEPEALIGKKIVLVCNLAPAKLCGIESQGMLLASGEETVRVIFLDKDTPNGERIH